MFSKLLIANRGEIAIRIQRACRTLGVRTVAVHSTADSQASFVQQADEAVCIGPASATGSYLNQAAILLAAEATGAEAIHPGYGFLSENADFAERVEAAGLSFVGPASSTIRIMGDKIAAKRAMLAAGVPCVPGPDSALPDDPAAVHAIARTIGYPVIVKAVGGGGGRGMRRVASEADLDAAVASAREEARNAFGQPALYIEKFLATPRHVEIQVLCDNHGTALWLGDRDCSMQRNHQKVLEEAPAPGIPRDEVAAVGERCVEACRRLGYRGVGTFEFLYENGLFAFIEMNTRLQVEHPVTEATTGLDIVQAQIRVAAGEKLSLTQQDIALNGHAIECRINAEDPFTFDPSPGLVTGWTPPEGVRVDTYLREGERVSPHYDSLFAKVIVHAPTRDAAIDSMQVALASMRIDGIRTNIPLQETILADEQFRSGELDIHLLEARLAARNSSETIAA
jgi:acetyl-CoA carboxylase biotin carboxylase subunit